MSAEPNFKLRTVELRDLYDEPRSLFGNDSFVPRSRSRDDAQLVKAEILCESREVAEALLQWLQRGVMEVPVAPPPPPVALLSEESVIHEGVFEDESGGSSC